MELCGENIIGDYFRFGNNECVGINLTESEVTSNDYETIEECSEQITHILTSSSGSNYITAHTIEGITAQSKVSPTSLLSSIWNNVKAYLKYILAVLGLIAMIIIVFYSFNRKKNKK